MSDPNVERIAEFLRGAIAEETKDLRGRVETLTLENRRLQRDLSEKITHVAMLQKWTTEASGREVTEEAMERAEHHAAIIVAQNEARLERSRKKERRWRLCGPWALVRE